ncbi:MAG TPA: hypothetical protein VL651_04220 [Bacteroidia bacterium]|jgi:LEA14-like dessication related protein|nr:hypothetical protein [Bacteroidia bacterium]
MKTKWKRIFISIGILVLLAGGLLFIFHERIIRHFIPTVKQTGGVSIVIKNDTSYVHSKVVVENNSFLEIEIDSMQYSVGLFDKTYLQDRLFIGEKLSAHTHDTIDFAFRIPYSAILKDVKTERKYGDSADYSFVVSLQYSTVFGKGKFLVNKSAKLELPLPPELQIVDVNYRKPDLRSILADVKIRITNNSVVALEIKDLVYAMNILKTGNINGSYRDTVIIKPKDFTLITIPVKIDVFNMGRTMFDILINKDQWDYTLKLNANLRSTDPVELTFHLDLTQSGKMELRK